MGLTREQLFKRLFEKVTNYIIEHGNNVGKYYFWHTYPICIQELCTDGCAVKVLAKSKELTFGDFPDGKEEKYTVRKVIDENIERPYIEAALDEMIEYDKKYKK